MTTTPHKSLKGLSPKRISRIVEDVLPLMTQGLTCYSIAQRLNMSKSQIHLDMLKAREMLAEEYVQTNIDEVRGEAIARQDWIWRTSVEAWNTSKKHGTPVAKFLDVASAAAKEKVKLSGAEIDLKLIQQNVSVSMATPQQVADTFQPMDASDFAAFATAHADAQARAAAAAKSIIPATTQPITVDSSDDDRELDEVPPGQKGRGVETGESRDVVDWTEPDPVKEPGPNRKIQHPFR